MAAFEDYYEILRVNPTAQQEDIEEAYKKLSNEHAPVGNSYPAAAETISKINIAYEILKDPTRRTRYHDEWLENKLYLAKGKPKYKAVYIPRNKTEDIPKNEADNLPKGKAEDIPKYKNETYGTRKINGLRIAIIILLLANLSLTTVFILTPLIEVFITQNPWILYVICLLIGALGASLIFSAQIRNGLGTLLKTTFRSTQRWITSKSVNDLIDRILFLILIIISAALLIYIYILPWLYQILIKGDWITGSLFVIVALFGGAFLTSMFWQYLADTFKPTRPTNTKYISNDSNANNIKRPISAKYIPNNSRPYSGNPNISEWTWVPSKMIDRFSTNIWNEILNFRPSRQYGRERGYHDELFNYLKIRFHQAESNKRKGASQPDIHIDHIAIEVKGPTLKRDLITLMDKSGRYLAKGHHTILFIVLFQPSHEITPNYFEELKITLLSRYPDVGVITKHNL